jgi:hypothetical protein
MHGGLAGRGFPGTPAGSRRQEMSLTEVAARRCIRFSAGACEQIRTGRKRITFRAGRRRFPSGEIVEGRCAEGVVLPLRITGCVTKALREVTEEEAREDLFESREVVLEGMRRFYPAMTWETEITLIRFEMADGVDDPACICRIAWWNME